MTPNLGRPSEAPGMGRIRHVHFIGIGGAGMSGIAEVMLNQGHVISGSDLIESSATRRLARLGARIHIGHAAENTDGADVVVRSSAIATDNPEVQAAWQKQTPVVPRAEMLGELMRYRHGIAIAGTHGKTTTTSLLTAIYQVAELDPTFVIGGLLESAGAHARLGASQVIIVEADESDASFLYLQPMVAVVTNIDADHLGAYDDDLERLKDAFVKFIQRLPFYGTAVVCRDDPEIAGLLQRLSRPLRTYGFCAQADYRAEALVEAGRHWRFRAERPAPHAALDVELAMPGRHNVQNALAAIAVATEEGVPDAAIQQGLFVFRGARRRFQVHDQVTLAGARITVVDDYGHHPTEVAAVLETARRIWPERRLVMAYQPHRYSRTRDLFDRFVAVLSQTDALILAAVYAAGEARIDGADSQALGEAIANAGALRPLQAANPADALDQLAKVLRDDDVLLVQGAGNISEISSQAGFGHAA